MLGMLITGSKEKGKGGEDRKADREEGRNIGWCWSYTWKSKYRAMVVLPYPHTFQDPRWMPETTDSTKHYIYYAFFLYVYTCDKV